MDNNILGRGSVLGNGDSGSGGGGNGSSGRAAGMYPPAVPSDTRARLDGVDHHTSNNTQQQQPAYPPHHRSSAVPAGHQKGLTDQQLHEQQQLIQRQLLQQQQHKQEQQGEYAEEEDMEAERDLAEDAQWKRIQQNTFTRWANEHLKSIQQNINSLEADLSDGLRLIALIEILSQKRMPKYNKRPTFRSQKLENVSVALKFLENEGIRIVNIDSSDIVDCKLKLILGLIWTLILHYSISMPMWEGEEDALNGSGPTPKQRLMGWIQSKLPEMPIGNFTNDWTSGKAVGALVDACAPGLCPDWDVWDPKDAVQNASEAMGLADDWLNVRQLIRPEEMVNPKIDEQSMMTYLSQYPNAKLKPGAPLRPKTNPNRVRAYGPGIEPTGPSVGAPANFTVETFSAGNGSVDVTVQTPNGDAQPADVRFNNDKNLSYSVSYVPKTEGPHKVFVKFSGRDIPKSPYTVQVEGHAGDASKVSVSGPGLQPDGVCVGRGTFFDINTKGAGRGTPEVVILDPAGHKTSVPAKLRQIADDTWRCEYVSPQVGLHSINVFYAGQPVPNSPFGVRVAPTSDARKVRVGGRGVQSQGVRVGDAGDFQVHTEGAGEGVPEVQIIGPGGVKQPVTVRKVDAHTYQCDYEPKKVGRYMIMVSYGGKEVNKSPFEVNVGPPKESSIVAYGPGLRAGVVGHAAAFVVETNGETGALGFSVAGPSQAEIECKDNGDGSALVKYLPTAPGEYAVHILCDGEDIPRSPFIAHVLPQADFRPELVRASGGGLQPNGVSIGRPAEFTVDTRAAGAAPLEVKVHDVYGVEVPVAVQKQQQKQPEGVQTYVYTPRSNVPHTVEVNYGGVATSGSPHRVYVGAPLDVSKVRASGPWLEAGGKVGTPTHFTVDTREAGDGDLEIHLLNNETGSELPCRVIDNEDGSFAVEVIPPTVGTYTTNMKYGGLKVPLAPTVRVTPVVDVSKIQVDGLEESVVMNGATDFTVDLTQLGAAIDPHKLLCSILDPRGNAIPSQLVQGSGDVVKIMYTPFEAGRHTIELLYDNAHVPGSPFVVHVKSGCDPSRCKAYGPGLQAGHTGEPCRFVVETRGAGNGGLSMAVEGPSEAKMTCSDNRDGSCDVEFLPTEPGEYDITIRFADKHIPGSPFRSLVTESVNPGKVRVYGPGIEEGVIRENVPTVFHIDVGAAGPGKVAVKLNNSAGKLVDSGRVEDKGNGVYAVHFVPPSPVGAVLTANVMFADEEVPFSPFVMKVLPQYEADKVRVGGVLEKGAKKCETPASLPARFEIDTRRAGQANTQVTIRDPKGKTLVSRLEKVEEGAYAVTFVPHEIGAHTVDIKYGEAEVAGSPFKVNALQTGDAKKCKLVDKLAKEQPFGNKSRISVDAREAGVGAVTCQIESTEGSDVDIEVIEKEGVFDIVYVLSEPGDYEMDIKFGGKKIPDGLFSIKAIEPPVESKLIAAHQQQDHHDSASSPLQRKVNKVVDQSSFLHEERLHSEQYAMQQQIIEESLTTTSSSSTSTVSAAAASSVTSAAYQNGHHHSTTDTAKTFRPISLDKLPLPSTGGTVLAEVKMPSGKVDKPRIEDNHDGTVRVQYDPREDGIHELYVKYNGEHVQGSPYKFHVDSISSGHVTAYGPGLTHGVSGDMTQFTISTKGAGAGGLSLAVEGPSKANITYHDNKDGTVGVTYLPTAPGEYKISVRFGDKNINGSPFFAKITGEGRKRNQISVGSCSEVLLPGAITDDDLRTLNASIQTPSGLEEPCFLKRMPSGNIGISFTPREIGDHQVSVKRQGAHISNSPFKVTVGEREVGDAKKVLVSGAALTEGKTHADNTFAVDTRNAGFGGLSLSIEGPSKAEINCTDKDDGTLNISYKPTEPGYYIVNLKFADHHVEGSPFTVKVSGEGSNRQREKIQRQRDAVPVKEVGSPCKLTFKMPGITSFDLGATVTSPSGTTDDAEIQEVKDGLYAVNFVPKELGAHTVSVKYTEMHIPGSPFQYTVGPLHDSGAHLVKAGGGGLERGEVGVPSEFNVWTREAGGGSLAISIEGPSKADIEFKDRMDGSCDVAYTVSEPGEYRIGMKFNDRHIPDSPHKVYISPAMGDAHLLEVAQFPSGAVQADTPAQFLVRMNGAKGQLDAKVIAPSNAEDDCFIQAIDSEESSVRFYPRESGIHSIHVKFNGVHIVGSPYRIKVGKDVADPACVQAHGDGLHEARTGQKADFLINTCNAGAGSLLMTMDGPAKVSMDCSEVEEGYKVRYTALLSGLYYMSIKYNNNHIVGSPFKITVAGKDLVETGGQETSSVVVETVAKYSKGARSGNAPVLPNFKSDATKVTSKGMGLKKAFLGKQNQFTINASEAGTGVLFVGLYHPRGPCEEVQTKHTGKNNYTVNYYIRERSDYMLIVMWNENHIPGSPFNVEVSLKNA